MCKDVGGGSAFWFRRSSKEGTHDSRPICENRNYNRPHTQAVKHLSRSFTSVLHNRDRNFDTFRLIPIKTVHRNGAGRKCDDSDLELGNGEVASGPNKDLDADPEDLPDGYGPDAGVGFA